MNKSSLKLGIAFGMLNLFLISASDQTENKSEKPPANKITVAVYPIKITGADKSLEPVLTSLLIAKLSQSTKLKVIEEAMMDEVLKRLNFANSDMCDNSQCQLQVGKLTPAQELIVPTVSKLGDKFIFDARVIDIEKSDIDFTSETKKVCNENQLDELIDDASIDLRVKFGEKDLKTIQAGQASSPAQAAPEEPLEIHNILGIVVVDDPSAVNNYHSSVRVQSVLPDSPCKDIVKPDDVITNINTTGHVVLGTKALNYIVQNMDDFKKLVSTIKPGDSVLIWLFSKGAMTSHHPVCAIPAPQDNSPAPSNKKVVNPAFTKSGKAP